MTTKDCVYRYRHIISKDFSFEISETEDICHITGKTIYYKKECKNCKSYVSRYENEKRKAN